ncbi:DUF2513 domain-containing protein [Brevibacillus laterosporus]|uniref:DUF2513 domain-containing protein n=1 Tax=Brevibacillus laterosporus TaxID=1465 RepID=UPI002E1BC8F5|nr:DUF2513 domain-containing protein [Brevibacillus laterosporus]
MELKHDCVRNILLTLESSGYEEILTLRNYVEKPLISDYDDIDIVYACEKLVEAGFINASIKRLSGNSITLRIKSITWDGHQFLDNIRDDSIWRETKQVSSKVASASLGILSDVASSLLKKTLGLE